VLNQMVGLVEPRPLVWDSIKAAIGPVEPQVAPEPTEVAPPLSPAEQHTLQPELSDEVAALVDNSNVVRLTTETKRWRRIATALSAVAAVLLTIVALQVFLPGALPEALRAKPRTQIVEVKTPAPASTPSAQYVALLQGQSGGPAFILTVDGATRGFTLRRVGAPAIDPGKSFELWLISDKLQRPRSLGVIGAGDFTERTVLSDYAADAINGATYAVTVEQAGGSPDGVPHSAPVYAGKLIETVPPR
jgi:anti-sigma-K factor RskA